MFTRKLLKKMGMKRSEVKEMALDAKDIIELGKLGYTKEEIEKLSESSDPTDMTEKMEALEKRIDDFITDSKNAAVRETVTESDDPEEQVDEALKILAGDKSA